MKQYKVIQVLEFQTEGVMNNMAKDGWEVVSTTYCHPGVGRPRIMITFSKNI